MGAWNMAEKIDMPNKEIFSIRLIEGVASVHRSQIMEMRRSKDTGNVFVRFKDSHGKELIGLLRGDL